MELLDVYNEKRQKTGKIINREDVDKLSENEYILSVFCWTINPSKKILITQRSLKKNRGGKWEDTHGAVKSGETSLEGMQRELREELGIVINQNELKLVKTAKSGNKIKDYYILVKDVKIEDISFNDNEVMNCKYVTIEEFKEMIENNECSFTDFKKTIFYEKNIESFLGE